MIKITPILLTLFVLLLSGCSGDPYEKYYGLWEEQDTNRVAFMKISKDGETILMTRGLLDYKKSLITGKKVKQKKEISTLNQKDDRLSIETPFGGVQLGLSEDKNILRFGDSEYKRADETRLKEANIEFVRVYEKNIKNKEECKVLRNEYLKERKLLAKETNSRALSIGKNKEEKNKLVEYIKSEKEKLKDKYKTQAGNIDNCRV